ncbi:MAG: hypothetical protein KAI18_01525 [Candidatus Aenigmarchaeota archaeon]|nr:hypothetical protein [Candidatus Aenigmarchaeota archaeon]
MVKMDDSRHNVTKINGLNKKDSKFNEDLIKGRIAEALIEQLFENSGYFVYRYGMENTIPALKNGLSKIKNSTAYMIRKMPDFVIQNKITKNVFFIEVKFRYDGIFNMDSLKEESDLYDKKYPYKDCYFVVVSKEHIKCITYEELEQGKKITKESSNNYLGHRKEFNLNKPLIWDFCKFSEKLFDKF